MRSGFIPYVFETSSPESVGIDPASIRDFNERLRAEGILCHGYMLYRHGKLAASSVASPYRMSDKRHVYSVSKSFTSTAIGIAVSEGLLTVEDRIIDIFPELAPENVSPNLDGMRVKHILSMNTGHDTDTLGRVALSDPGWARRFLSLDVEHEPGTYFAYNSTATYMLSAVITKLTGMKLVDYLRTRLFDPLGISGVWWEESPDGVSDGGWGIHVSMEDMLKLGVLYLNKGVFGGRRILPESWVADASSVVSETSDVYETPDWKLGYGYQFWGCRHGGFRADGAYGQFSIVMPEKDAVAVITAETGMTQRILDIFWETIYASMSDRPLPERSCVIDTACAPVLVPPVIRGSDIAPVMYRLGENQFRLSAFVYEKVGSELILTVVGASGQKIEVVCGAGKWEYNHFDSCPMAPTGFVGHLACGIRADIAAAYGDDDGISVALQFVSTPHGVVFRFGKDSLSVYYPADNRSVEVGIIG